MTTAEQIKQEWWTHIPAITFPAAAEVQLAGSVNRAFVRFLVNGIVSVYLDIDDNLGSVGQPYWELYNLKEQGDTQRFLLHETKKLQKAIAKELSR